MMHFLFTVPILSTILLCSASILPPRAFSHTGTAHQHSLTLLTSIRQSLTCSSRADCGESQLCTQTSGELFCEKDCEGFCIPESERDSVCSCNVPCKVGICANPFAGEEMGNGFCATGEFAANAEPLKCPGSGPPETSPDLNEPSKSGESGGPDQPDEGSEPSDETNTEDSESDSDEDGSDSENVEPGSDSDTSEPEDNENGQESTVSDPDNDGTKPGSNGKETENPMPSTEPSTDSNGPEPENTSGQESENEPGADDESDDDTNPANSEDTAEPVCIGADMLDKFEFHELVFPKHVLSRVLCDASGSCATKGHIVTYEGKGMMMSSYCAIVGCTKKVMYVNSPKYRGGLRVGSRSKGMEFTSFAARFATRGEEVVLGTAVRLGL